MSPDRLPLTDFFLSSSRLKSLDMSKEAIDFVRQRAGQSPTPSLSVVAGLAWNEAFKTTFLEVPGLRVAGPWVYASCVTLLAVLVLYLLRHYAE